MSINPRQLIGLETQIVLILPIYASIGSHVQSLILDKQQVFIQEEEVQQLLGQQYRRPIKIPTQIEKKQLRLGFQSSELRAHFEEVVRQQPGRKSQALKIFDFLAMSQNGNTTPLCLHGNTGCGKTTLVTKIMDFFQQKFQTVKVAYINCMSMWSTTHVYAAILSTLFSVNQKKKSAAKSLSNYLQNNHKKDESTKIIILDEIDQFINDQNFMYNMLQWLTSGSKLVLILISNVIDLTLKLDGKLQSRMKFKTIIFEPYSYQQIEEIIRYKYPTIRSLAVQGTITYVAKKIANINSDIRLLEKIYSRIENQFARNGSKTLLTLPIIKSLVYEDNKLPQMLAPYATILNILNKAAQSKQAKKKQISHEIRHRLYIQGSHFPESKEILLILCDLQDCGLITLTSKNKNCDMTYYDYGIKVEESLRMLYSDNDN